MAIAYRVKESVLESILSRYENYKEICTAQEFFEYDCGLPLLQYKSFFVSKNIPHIDPFIYDRDKGAAIVSEVITKSYSDIK